LRNTDENTVVVRRLLPGSLALGTPIKAETEILAINGRAVHNFHQAADIIKSSTQLEFTTFDAQTTIKKAPFCYIEVAPTSKINPGISFNSCCDRTIVMIGDIFLSDLRRTRLRCGDIVLAVNGVPVWKPEQADTEQLVAARDSKALVLYCVDMDALHDFFVTKVNKTHGDRTAQIFKKGSGIYSIRERDCDCRAKVNFKTQLFDDETEWHNRIKGEKNRDYSSKTLHKKVSYAQVCEPTLGGLNDLMKKQLLRLKLKIVGHAWNSAIEKSEDDIPTYAIPSAPSAPLEFGIPVLLSPNADLPVAAAVPIEDETASHDV